MSWRVGSETIFVRHCAQKLKGSQLNLRHRTKQEKIMNIKKKQKKNPSCSEENGPGSRFVTSAFIRRQSFRLLSRLESVSTSRDQFRETNRTSAVVVEWNSVLSTGDWTEAAECRWLVRRRRRRDRRGCVRCEASGTAGSLPTDARPRAVDARIDWLRRAVLSYRTCRSQSDRVRDSGFSSVTRRFTSRTAGKRLNRYRRTPSSINNVLNVEWNNIGNSVYHSHTCVWIRTNIAWIRTGNENDDIKCHRLVWSKISKIGCHIECDSDLPNLVVDCSYYVVFMSALTMADVADRLTRRKNNFFV